MCSCLPGYLPSSCAFMVLRSSVFLAMVTEWRMNWRWVYRKWEADTLPELACTVARVSLS